MRNPHWAWRPLGELFSIGAGKTMSASARTGANQTPFLRTSNVLWDEIDLSDVDQMSIGADELAAKSLLPGDLLVCEGGEIGRAAVWTGRKQPMSFQNHLHRLRSLSPEVDARYYVYFLQSAFTQLGLFEGAGNKTTIPNLSRNRLLALEVPHPSLAEQSAIANLLAEARRALMVEASTVTTAEQLKQTTMRELFTRGLRRETLVETELGPLPRTWNWLRLAGLRDWLQYGTSVKCSIKRGRYPVLRIPNIAPAHVDPTDLKYCEMEDEDAAIYALEIGDLLFIRTNGVLERLGTCAVFEGRPTSALFASYLIRARLKTDRVVPKFAAYFFSSDRGTSLVAGSATPAADGKYNLNTGIIDSLPCPLPPTLSEQNEIVAILAAIDEKIDVHKRRRVVLEDLFKSLLHKLMTGEIRVSDLDLSALNLPLPAVQASVEH